MTRASCRTLFLLAVAGGAIVAAQSTGSKPAQAPIFEVDPFWP